MKNLFFLLITALSISHVWSQEVFKLNPSPQQGNISSCSYAPQADEITMSWLTSTTEVTSFGLNGAGSISVYMEFYPEDMINFNSTGKKPLSVKQIQFHINEDNLSMVASGAVCIRQGSSLIASKEAVSQTVTGLTGGWNQVDLAESYTIDHTQNLYIGYQLTQSAAGYPCSVAAGNNLKQAWLQIREESDNLTAAYDYVFLIQAIATSEDSPENEIALQPLDIPSYAIQENKVAIEGSLKNSGIKPLTSFILEYSVNGESASPHTFTDLNIASDSVHVFKYPDSLTVSEAKTYNILVTVSSPNGSEDITTNNSQAVRLQVYSEHLPRMVLHESFTSSTCPPCKAGNQSLESVLGSVDSSKWVNIRYQMDWPSTGDPYYTEEGGIRRDYYKVSSIPQMVVDGGSQFADHPGSYDKTILNESADIPAIGLLSGRAETAAKTVKAEITLAPVTNTENPALHLFAAVVEKKTAKNKKSNGENEFFYVMKKFLTAAEGESVGNLKTAESKTFNFSYTFNGDYRLPADAYTPVQHDKEHSIESFENLMVVFWIQDIQTQDVYQAGKMDATFTASDGLNDIIHSNTSAYIHDGLLWIHSGAPVWEVAIYTVFGQKVLSETAPGKVVDVNGLNAGIYIVKLQTQEGEKGCKVIK
jgi:hypothetical protein